MRDVATQAAKILRSRGIFAVAHPSGRSINVNRSAGSMYLIDGDRLTMTPEQLADEVQSMEAADAVRWHESIYPATRSRFLPPSGSLVSHVRDR